MLNTFICAGHNLYYLNLLWSAAFSYDSPPEGGSDEFDDDGFSFVSIRVSNDA